MAVAVLVIDGHAAMQELRELGGIERRIDRRREQGFDLVEQEAAVAVGA